MDASASRTTESGFSPASPARALPSISSPDVIAELLARARRVFGSGLAEFRRQVEAGRGETGSDDGGSSAGVREPRRPRPTLGSGSAVLPLPPDDSIPS